MTFTLSAPSPAPTGIAAHRLEPLFTPRSIAFIGGSNILDTLRYQREMGFAGDVWVVNPRHERLDVYDCVPSVRELPAPPDLAYVAIRRELAVQAIAELREIGCRAVICHAAGFAESGGIGEELNTKLLEAAGDMPLLGPNVLGIINVVDKTAVAMEHYGVLEASEGVAIVSQGGTLLCDAAWSGRSIPFTHLVAVGNQAQIQTAECVDFLLDDPRVKAIGLSFETLDDIELLRRVAVKALRLGKPIVALKLGNTDAGARAAASHTASMTGLGAAWDALFDRLGIIATRSEAEFLETLKLCSSGQIPRGPRAMVISASGVYSILLADHLSAAGFELPQPAGEHRERVLSLLPAIATPGNPQDVTAAVWGDERVQRDLFAALLDDEIDVVLGVQNFPPQGVGDPAAYFQPIDALGAAVAGREIAAVELAPLADSFPADARDRATHAGLAPMQGLEECMAALRHGLWWHRRHTDLLEVDLSVPVSSPSATIRRDHALNEAEAKAMLAAAGVCVPDSRVVTTESVVAAADELGYPVVIKALDARLLHKTEVGAVRVGLRSATEVRDAIEDMRRDMARLAPEVALREVLVEVMAQDVVGEVMVSVTQDPSVGIVMMLAGGGVEAELWNDSFLLAPPFTRGEIVRALDRLKVAARLRGWRGRPAADMDRLIDTIERIGDCALSTGSVDIEINPLLVGRHNVTAVDAVVSFHHSDHHEEGETR
ncbi:MULTISPECIES: acetate--CoA ligase family protein [Microbacterium]|uniref:acetate--CoA ligase family protein n=1 Tax=Microbacterium TaxID=33882 RepID=UPI000D64DF1E|nr:MULTISPECIES: acetate--CoA ligase family protein [Microbacterium]